MRPGARTQLNCSGQRDGWHQRRQLQCGRGWRRERHRPGERPRLHERGHRRGRGQARTGPRSRTHCGRCGHYRRSGRCGGRRGWYYCRMGSSARRPLWDARFAGSTQCTMGGIIGPHVFDISGPKPAYVIRKWTMAFSTDRGRLPHQHHRGQRPARLSEDETELIRWRRRLNILVVFQTSARATRTHPNWATIPRRTLLLRVLYGRLSGSTLGRRLSRMPAHD